MPFFIILMRALGLFNTRKGVLTITCFKLYTYQKAEFKGTMDMGKKRQ